MLSEGSDPANPPKQTFELNYLKKNRCIPLPGLMGLPNHPQEAGAATGRLGQTGIETLPVSAATGSEPHEGCVTSNTVTARSVIRKTAATANADMQSCT